MSFQSPKWDATENHYVIDAVPVFSERTRVSLGRDSSGTPEFSDKDIVHNITDATINQLINEGNENKWFSKLPSHEQLMKRVRHSFKGQPKETDNSLVLNTLLLTPKQVTFLWTPITVTKTAPPIYFDDSDDSLEDGEVRESNSDNEPEPEISESNLPPVSLTDDTQENQEEYLLTRLRAAKARVETEQIRMQYFEATGRMPPDSESEDD